MAPPSDGTLAFDAGSFFFAPDGSDPDADRFVAGLPPLTVRGGRAEWLVTVFEDPQTRDTAFLNAHGDEMPILKSIIRKVSAEIGVREKGPVSMSRFDSHAQTLGNGK